MNAPTDEQLLAEYLDGDPAGFELLVRRHVRELYQFVSRFTADSVAAEDVVQETLLQVHISAERFDSNRRFKPWLFTIAANKARDHLRRRKRKRELPIDAEVEREGDSSQRYIDLFASPVEVADDALAMDEKRRLVRRTLAAMPEKLKEVLILSYYHRFPYKEIGEILGIPLGTVKSRLHASVARFARDYQVQVQGQADQRGGS